MKCPRRSKKLVSPIVAQWDEHAVACIAAEAVVFDLKIPAYYLGTKDQGWSVIAGSDRDRDQIVCGNTYNFALQDVRIRPYSYTHLRPAKHSCECRADIEISSISQAVEKLAVVVLQSGKPSDTESIGGEEYDLFLLADSLGRGQGLGVGSTHERQQYRGDAE